MTALDLDHAVAALLAINSDELPFELTAERTNDGAVVTGKWKVWDVTWEQVLGRGMLRRDYVVIVTLDGATGTYTFIETSTDTQAQVGVGAGGLQARGERRWFRGKTLQQRSFRIVLSRKTTSEDRQGTTTGPVWTGSFNAADLKGPIFGTLRGLGWRPPKDGRWARMWEQAAEQPEDAS